MATDSEKARENMERFSYARDNGHLDFVAKATTCDNYFLGEQWDQAAKDRLNLLNKPIITLNKVLSTCATIFGEQLNNRADVSFRPAKDATAEVATALDKVWLHIASSNRLDWLESEVATDGFIRGRGFFDVRIDFDDSMYGEVRISQLNSKNVLIDPDAEEYDPDTWKEVFITKWLTADDIEQYYGRGARNEVVSRAGVTTASRYDTVDWLPDTYGDAVRSFSPEYGEYDDTRRLFRIVERQYRKLKKTDFFVDLETGDMRPVPETWERERIQKAMQAYNLGIRSRPHPIIRWTVSVGEVLLHDAQSPYRHFTPVPYFPYFRHGRTIGIVENLISPQDLLNKSVSQELHIVNTTANSGWVVKNGSLGNMTVEELQEHGGEDGLVVVANTTVNDIIKLQPNQVPSGIDRLSYKADEALKEVSMVSDSMRGFDREDVAAKAIQAKQARGTVSLAKPFDNLAFTRQLVSRNVLDLVQSFYTEPRVILITGRDLNAQAEPLELNQPGPEGVITNDLTAGEYTAVVTTVPARDTFEQSQLAEALELRQLGIAIPDDVMVEHSHLNRKREIVDRIKQLTGGAEPTEAQQQMAQLDMQLRQLEAQEKQVDMQVKQANAQLAQARAQETMAKTQNPEQGPDQKIELAKLALEREKMLMEIQLKREQLEQELMLAREKAQLEAQAKQEAARVDAEVKRQKADMDVRTAMFKSQADQQIAQQKMSVDAELGMAKQRMAEEQGAAQQQLAEQQQTAQQRLAERQAAYQQKMAKANATRSKQ